MVAAIAKINISKSGSVNKAISSVTFPQRGSDAVTKISSALAENRDSSSEKSSVNQEYAYTVDYSAPYSSTYNSEAAQAQIISRAVNAGGIGTPAQSGFPSQPNTGAWLGQGAAASTDSFGGALSRGLGGGIGGLGGGSGGGGIGESFRGGSGGTIGGLQQSREAANIGEVGKSNLLNADAQVATLNTCLATEKGYSGTSTGAGMSYTVAKIMKEQQATLGQAMDLAHGQRWWGKQTINRTGAEIAANAGSAENPATFAIALVAQHSGPRFAASGNTLKEIALASGVPAENIKIATSLSQAKQFAQEAIQANRAISGKMRADGTLGEGEKAGGLVFLHHSHGGANGSGPQARSSCEFGSEDSIEKMIIDTKLQGEFAWGAAMHGSCHSGGFDGGVAGMEASEEDKRYQSEGVAINADKNEENSGSSEFQFS